MHETFTVAEVYDESYRARMLVFDRALPAQPGQFVMVWLPGMDERPYSIALADPLALLVVAVGPFSRALHTLKPGDQVWIRGPLGHGFHLPAASEGKRLLLVGGGYGVAPLRYLARAAIAAGCEVEVCVGARTAKDLLQVNALRAEGADVHVTTEDGSAGQPGLVTEAVASAIERCRPDALYACGPMPMLEAVEQLALRYRISHQLSWEERMRCGMGLCGACEVHGRGEGWLACHDGPVSEHTF